MVGNLLKNLVSKKIEKISKIFRREYSKEIWGIGISCGITYFQFTWREKMMHYNNPVQGGFSFPKTKKMLLNQRKEISMSQFKRTKELKIFRYYQKDYGAFVDVERHRSKCKLYIGSLSNTIDRGTTPPIVTMGEITSDLLCHLENQNEIALGAFESIYNEFLNEYAFEYLVCEYAPVENWSGRIDLGDASEFKAVRYRYKKFQVEFMTVLNPKKEDKTITYVYILDKKSDYKVLCDFFDFELLEGEYEELLESEIKKYIAYFYCEEVGATYDVVGHYNKRTFYDEKASEEKVPPVGNASEKHIGESDETIQALPFC
ncbi:MAG: hypothetical protein NC548_35295 [Lachnospiraceae bacterium]|nr:hypothetical protein [Lachnospiraceae bacterium]